MGDQQLGHCPQLDVALLGVPQEHRESLVRVEVEPLHQDPLRLPDQLARVDRQPEVLVLPGARQRCASAPPAPDLETPLRQVETTLAELDRRIAEIEGTRASAEVAKVWQANPELGQALAGVQDKVRRARELSSQARADRDLGLAFQAGDLAADARDELAGLLTSVSEAIRNALASG